MWIFIVGYVALLFLSITLCRAAAAGDRSLASSNASRRPNVATGDLGTKRPKLA